MASVERMEIAGPKLKTFVIGFPDGKTMTIRSARYRFHGESVVEFVNSDHDGVGIVVLSPGTTIRMSE